MVLDDTSMNWFRLRERRSSLQTRTKLNLTAARRQTFAAAMGQFEEQFTAAKVVTAATRPLNLYYGLCQAGIAIATAHADDPWSFSSHGLHLVDREAEFSDMMVRPEGDGGFQRVAAATGSPAITEPVSLGRCGRRFPTWPRLVRCPARRGRSPGLPRGRGPGAAPSGNAADPWRDAVWDGAY